MTENEDLLSEHVRDGKPRYRIYEPAETVIVLGAGRRAEADVLLEIAARDRIPVRKRKGGGGTVVLSPGQVVLALVCKAAFPFENRGYFSRVNGWIQEALAGLGVSGVEERGVSDLAIGERKILGSSLFRRRRILFYQSSLLVASDLALFPRYLRFPSLTPEYRRGRDHEQFCTTLTREGYGFSCARVMTALATVVERELPLLEGEC